MKGTFLLLTDLHVDYPLPSDTHHIWTLLLSYSLGVWNIGKRPSIRTTLCVNTNPVQEPFSACIKVP